MFAPKSRRNTSSPLSPNTKGKWFKWSDINDFFPCNGGLWRGNTLATCTSLYSWTRWKSSGPEIEPHPQVLNRSGCVIGRPLSSLWKVWKIESTQGERGVFRTSARVIHFSVRRWASGLRHASHCLCHCLWRDLADLGQFDLRVGSEVADRNCFSQPWILLSDPEFRRGSRCFGISKQLWCACGRNHATAQVHHITRLGLNVLSENVIWMCWNNGFRTSCLSLHNMLLLHVRIQEPIISASVIYPEILRTPLFTSVYSKLPALT